MNISPEDKVRFQSKISKGDVGVCWNWKPKPDTNGYGAFTLSGQKVGAHRVAYEIAHGEIPKGLQVLHQCDNPICCNPAHLFLGTIAVNNRDKADKGRSHHPNGEKNGNHRFTNSDIDNIRSQYSLGFKTQKELAIQFKTDQGTISAIVNRKKWAHI